MNFDFKYGKNEICSLHYSPPVCILSSAQRIVPLHLLTCGLLNLVCSKRAPATHWYCACAWTLLDDIRALHAFTGSHQRSCGFLSVTKPTHAIWGLLFAASEKAVAPHSSPPACKIPWMEEPGGLQSMLRVGHDWATSLSLFTFMHWRRKRQPTPVFLPGESQGPGSLVGCRLWGHTESDSTEVT